MAATGNDGTQDGDGAGIDKFQTAYQGEINRTMAERAGRGAANQPLKTVSDNGLNLIQRYEKYSPTPYVDQNPSQTIGWGHKIRPGESFPSGIDIESAQKLFRSDVADAEAVVRDHARVPLNQNQYDALVSLAYNSGSKPFTPGQKFGDALNQGDYAEAVRQLGTLIHTRTKGGSVVVSNGLKRRRADEATLFNAPPSP
jgi:lysozyme